MVWTINVMSAVLLTSLTGSIVFLVWYAVGRLLEYLGFANVVYELLKAVLGFWYLPVAFLVLLAQSRQFRGDRWGGFLFLYTPVVYRISIVFCIAWFAGVLFFGTRYILDNVRMHRIYKNAVPISEEGWDCFQSVCAELNIAPGRVEAVESARDHVSKIFGLWHPTIVFPVAEFDEEQYRIMFIHELTHYKQKTLLLKHLTAIALVFHFMNPFMWLFDRKVQEWGETACDYDSIRYVGDVRTYFRALLRVAGDDKNRSSFQANLLEQRSDLETRIRRMKRSYKVRNNRKRWAAVLAVFVMVVVSTGAVSAATVYGGDMYMDLYNASVVESEKGTSSASSDALGPLLHHVGGLSGWITETEEIVGSDGLVANGEFLAWTVPGKGSVRTQGFEVESGKEITLAISSEQPDAALHIGIIKPDGSREYVSGNDFLAYQFACDVDGIYCVYVQNLSRDEVSVSGTYVMN
jgi:beta-lactamase regulating signal transducer with metallopeptidase domain